MNKSAPETAVAFRRDRRFIRWIVGCLLLVAIAVFFLPVVIAKTELRNRILPWCLPELAAKVEIGQAHLSWLSPIKLQNVNVRAPDGEMLLVASTVKSSRTLLDIARNSSDVGRIQVVQPQAILVLDESGTNLDELLDSLMTVDDDEPIDDASSGTAFELEIVNGRIELQDKVTQDQCLLSPTNLVLAIPTSTADPVLLECAATAQHLNQTGEVTINFSWQQPDTISAHDLGSGAAKVKTSQFPVAALAPALRRMHTDIVANGDLTGTIECNWRQSAHGPELGMLGHVNLENARLTSPSLLGPDVLASEHITLDVEGDVADGSVHISNLASRSTFGQLELKGELPLEELFSTQLAEDFVSWKSKHTLTAVCDVDLREIASSLTHTLRIRKDTSIIGGTVQLNLESRPSNQKTRLISGRIASQDIVATTGTKTVSWQQPLETEFRLQSNMHGWILDSLNAQSDFFEAQGSGSLAAGSFSAAGSLDRLYEQLSQFCELGLEQLAGKFNVEGTWATDDAATFSANSRMDVDGFLLSVAGTPPWQENKLHVGIEASGQLEQNRLNSLAQCMASLESGADVLTLELTKPVNAIGPDTRWPIHARMAGQCNTWLTRLRPWFRLDHWQVQGHLNAEASGKLSAQKAALSPCQIEISEFSAVGKDRTISEPLIKLVGDVTWNAEQQTVTLPQMDATSSTIALRAQGIQANLATTPIQAQGVAAYRGDLSRLYRWSQTSSSPPKNDMRGQLQGNLRVTTEDGILNFESAASCSNFSLRQRNQSAHPQDPHQWSELWREPQVQVMAVGSFQSQDSTLQLEQMRLAGEVAQVQARGVVSQILAEPIADISGEVDYDLLGVFTKLKNWLGTGIQMAGRQRQPFSVKGPLSINSLQLHNRQQGSQASAGVVHPQLLAETTVGWDSATCYGFKFGPQQVGLQLRESVLATSPIETALSGGNVSLSPRIELGRAPATLVLDNRSTVQGVQLTPEMCEDWLKYVAPLVAGAATAEGQVSAQINSAQIPFGNTQLAEASGVVDIEFARVQPGPLAQQLLSVLREASVVAQRDAPSLSFLEAGSSWLDIRQQRVEFQMMEGRVYHRNLTLVVGNLPVQTSGWVSVDQNLSIVAQIPIQSDWIKNAPLLTGLQNQTIQIPIHGTLSRPQLDRRAFAQLTQQIIGSTAERFLHDELEKGLKKLLGPK